MKKISIALLAIAVLSPLLVLAGEVHIAENYSLRKGEIVREDLYAAGNSTTIAGDVTGDVVTAAFNVFAGGSAISEDALILGGTVNVMSDIGGDLRMAGGKVFFGGSVKEDLAVGAQEIQTLPQSIVGGNFIAAAGRVVLNGVIEGDIKIAAGEVFLNERIGGNVSVTADRLVIGERAVIEGNLDYASGKVAEIADGAQIAGTINFKEINTRPGAEKFLPTLWGTWLFIRFLVLLISALVLHGIFRNISTKFVVTSINHPWKSLLRGFLFAVAVPFAILLVFLTFVGIPFGILGIALYSIFLIISSIYGPVVIGSLLWKLYKRDSAITVSWKTIIVGVIAVIALTFLPYAGRAIKYAFVLVALGGIYQVLFDKFVETR